MPMLSDMPLTRSVVSKARAVDNHLLRSAGRANTVKTVARELCRLLRVP